MPTIKDIAREAGVSHGTVSNVLNKTGKVSVEKIKLVEEAARKLGYVPNTQAQMLRQGTPTSIALLIPTLQEDIYLELFKAIQTGMLQAGYDTALYETNDITGTEKSILERLPLSRTAAVVSVSCLIESEPEAYQDIPCPVFFAERIPAHLSDSQYAVSFDYTAAGTYLGTWMREHKKKRIAFFSSSTPFSCNVHLLEGIRHVLGDGPERIWQFSSDISLMTAKSFSIAQADPSFDCILVTSALRAQMVDFALEMSKLPQRPALLSLGGFTHSYCTTYLLDYAKIGTHICSVFNSWQKDASVLPGKCLLEARGIPYTFPNVQRQSPCELTMLTLDAPSTQALQRLLPLFEEVSNIRLKISSMSYDDLHSHIEMLNSQFYFDLIRMDIARFHTLGPATYLPLEQAGISPEDFQDRMIKPAYSKYCMADGTRCALPFDPSVQIFLYRKDLFEDAKLCRAYYERYREVLSVPKTPEQYLHIAEFFTSYYNPDSPTRYGTSLTVGSSFFAASDFLPYFLADHYELFHSGQALQLNTPEMEHAMELYLKMSRFATHQNTWSDSIQQFAAGNVAALTIYSNHTGTIINTKHSNIAGKVGAAIIPGGHPLLGGGVLGISRYSTKLEACRQFFSWYYSLDTASFLVRLGGTSPLLATYDDFRNCHVFPWLSTAKKSFEIGTRGINPDYAPGFSTVHYEFALGIAIRNLITGTMSPKEAAQMAQAIYSSPSSLLS